jgi:hypothetical protein
MDVPPPGLRMERLAILAQRAVGAMTVDLGGAHVLTEAATGAYVVTPVLAALAGASHVDAVTRSTRYGTIDEVRGATTALAEQLGVSDRIHVHAVHELASLVPHADVITNSGHVRPIDAALVAAMKPTCVVPLMFEAWEIDMGRDDVDLDALRSHGIRFAGTNERHPAVDVFSYLGPMAVRLLGDGAISAYGARLLVLCDNPFAPYLERGLTAAGAQVVMADRFEPDLVHPQLDAVVVALAPTGAQVLDRSQLAAVAERAPSTCVAQFWGDIERDVAAEIGLPVVPVHDPGAGHMGVLPSAVGPEPIVRLQAGGLKVAEVLMRPDAERSDADREFIDEL